MAECTMADIGVKFKYFDYNDLPARQLAPNRLPEVYKPGKGWYPVDDTFNFLHSIVPVDKDRIREMIDHLERMGPPTKPD